MPTQKTRAATLTEPGPLARSAVLRPQRLEQCLFATALAQWRQFQGQATYAVIQVFAKAADRHLFT